MSDRVPLHPIDALNRVFARVPRWVASSLVVVLPAVGTLLITFGQERSTAGQRWQFWIGVGMVLAGIALQVFREWMQSRASAGDVAEAMRLRVAMKDALQPVAELTAAMTELSTQAERQVHLTQVAQQAVGSLCLLLRGVDRLRAVVYEVTDTGMAALAYMGRGTPPKDFHSGTERGDRALEMVDSGGGLFVRDIDAEQLGPAYRGSGVDYSTFISVAISTQDHSYGMVTVDAPLAGDLVDTDQQIVMLMADLLAIGFAIAIDGAE